MAALLIFLTLSTAHAYQDMPAGVKASLTRACAGCHGPDGQENWIFDGILDSASMIKTKHIIPGDPDSSPIVRLQNPDSPKRMPPKGNGLSAAEQAALKDWIRSMGPAAQAPTKRKPASPTCYTPDQTMQIVDEDVKKNPNPNARYISISELDLGGADYNTNITALNKTLNSLSWSKELIIPERLPEANGPILKIDISKFGWSKREWDNITGRSPSRATYQQQDAFNDVAAALATKTPVVQGNWLVPELMKPKNYGTLLGLPDNLGDFEKKLKASTGCAPHRDLINGQVARSGVTEGKSGVAFHNRIIERHECPDGTGYWVSYDYADSKGNNDITRNPLTQKANGGEMIYRLPNGMLGFFLIQGNGAVIEKAPTNIVQDPARPSRDKAVENGISCVRCHSAGFINKKDEVAAAVQRRARNFSADDLAAVKTLYPDTATFTSLIEKDSQDYQAKLRELGDFGGTGGKFTEDPITSIVQKYERTPQKIKNLCAAQNDVEINAPEGGASLDDLLHIFK